MARQPEIVNMPAVFVAGCEVYYSFRTQINKNDYPQVHDFYEIILVTDGKLEILLNNNLLILESRSFLLIRPGDIHTKIEVGPSAHINLAFPSSTVEALFSYLLNNSSNPLCDISKESYVPIVRLTTVDTAVIQNRLDRLNQFPLSAIDEKNTHLRAILIDIIYTYLMPELRNKAKNSNVLQFPTWLDVNNLSEGMDYLIRHSGRSAEHICRTFRKYLGCTPSAYINSRRLTYAANLLTHTDIEIVDIAYESGFQSVNYFYHLFKKEYNLSPLKYKKIHKPKYL